MRAMRTIGMMSNSHIAELPAGQSSAPLQKSLPFKVGVKMGETSDLFEPLAATSVKNIAQSASQKPTRRSGTKTAHVDHLAATRKLHWQLRRATAHSPEEVKAGRLICRHLLAMLAEEVGDAHEEPPQQRAMPVQQRG